MAVLTLVAGLFWTAAHAADLETAERAYRSGDYATAWNELIQLQSDPRAMFALGLMTQKGQGRPVDLFAAAEFYKKSARAGHPLAAIQLGGLYERGEGVPRDGGLAQELYGWVAVVGMQRADNDAMSKRAIINAKNNITYLWARQNGLLKEALCLSAETLGEQPNNAAYLDTYGFILMRMGKLDEAEKFLKKAQQQQTSSGNLEHLGDIADLRGDKAGAQRWWQNALKAAVSSHDMNRLQQKLAGKPNDFDSFSAFELKNGGLGENCSPTT